VFTFLSLVPVIRIAFFHPPNDRFLFYMIISFNVKMDIEFDSGRDESE
jgi:predicted solute-binding protein